ncbi:MAG: hypothetical protein ACFE8A_13300 [Candidatus Hodarchaeota archaeon]
MNIIYKISLRKTKKWLAANYPKKNEIKIYLARLFDFIQDYLKTRPFLLDTVFEIEDIYFYEFTHAIIDLFLIERICFETRKLRLKIINKCEPFCKPKYVADRMLNHIKIK